MSCTVVTAWYNLKNKFNQETYRGWISNFLDNARCNIVLYTNNESVDIFEKYRERPNIKIVIKELQSFMGYQYRDDWIQNHTINHLLNGRICWELNMLWSEKINFVKCAAESASAGENDSSGWYIWCDIGYFRNYNANLWKTWPNPEKIRSMQQSKIYYGQVCNDDFITSLEGFLQHRRADGLPQRQIPPKICSVAGGFFVIHKEQLQWWHDTYYRQLHLYFKHKYLVKDDQIILIDCILGNKDHFVLCADPDPRYDIWFMFQRLLI